MDELSDPTIKIGSNEPEAKEQLKSRNRLPQHIAALSVNLANFAYGSVIAWTSPAQPMLQSETTPVLDSPISNNDVSWLGSLVFLGALFGSPLFSFMSDRIGRKPSLLICSLPYIAGWLMILFGNSVYMLFAARFISGLGCGGSIVLVPVYIGEIADEYVRGALGVYLSVLGNLGILFSYIIGAVVSFQTFVIVSLIFPVLFLMTFAWMPESPLYLLEKEDISSAASALKWLQNCSHEEALETVAGLAKQRKETHNQTTFKEVFLTSPGTRLAVYIGMIISSTQMLSGTYAVLGYTVNIFEMAGSDISAQLSTIIVGATMLLAAMLSYFLVDRLGRRVLLITSIAVMSMCMAILGTYLYLQSRGIDLSLVGFIPLTCLSAHLFSFGFGLGPVNMVLISEIFSQQVRSTAASISLITMWLTACIVSKFYSQVAEVLGAYIAFWFFAGYSLFSATFCYWYVPETKNRTIDDIIEELDRKK